LLALRAQALPARRAAPAPAASHQRRGVCRVRAAAATAAPTPSKLSAIEVWNGDKRLQTQVFPLAENTTAIRSLDWDRDRFDIEFG
jgi:hypothetical protein